MNDYVDEIPIKRLYGDDGNIVTNPATLRALAESDEIIAAWENKHSVEYNTPEVIDMLQYDYDDEDYDRPLSPETLRAIEETKRIVAAWEKLSEASQIG